MALRPKVPGVAGPEELILELDPGSEISGEALTETGQLTATLLGLLGAGRIEEAARLYAGSQGDVGYPVIQAVGGDQARLRSAGRMFQSARDFGKAAECAEGLDNWAGAGALYEQADDAFMAAEMYLRAGDRIRAAPMLERSGNPGKAAELYEAAGALDRAAACHEKACHAFAAGILYARLAKPAKALQLLQRVPRGDRDWLKACRAVGELLSTHGQVAAAVARYDLALQGAELTEETAPVFSHLARCLEQAGDLARAEAVLTSLVAWRFDFEEAATRLQALQGRAGPAASATARPMSATVATAAVEVTPAPVSVVARLDGFEFLRGTELFSDLSLTQLKAVHAICEARRFAAGEVLAEAGALGAPFLLVRRGKVQLFVPGAPKEHVFERAGPGTPLGVVNLFGDVPSPARFVAEEEVEVLAISPQRFASLLASDDQLAVRVFRRLARTLATRLLAAGDLVARLDGRA
jgi:tetratricopeptide (TPR) repeat protein